VPQDQDAYARKSGFVNATRVQAAVADLIVGASHIQMPIAQRFARITGEAEFIGIDARWMRGGVMLRGEYIDGRPFPGARTFGGYIDLIVHRRFMGPVTAVARAERLDYLAGRFSDSPRRYTAGARIQFTRALVGSVNVIRETAHRTHVPYTALDFGFTMSAGR
jgi:hypothetical protein